MDRCPALCMTDGVHAHEAPVVDGEDRCGGAWWEEQATIEEPRRHRRGVRSRARESWRIATATSRRRAGAFGRFSIHRPGCALRGGRRPARTRRDSGARTSDYGGGRDFGRRMPRPPEFLVRLAQCGVERARSSSSRSSLHRGAEQLVDHLGTLVGRELQSLCDDLRVRVPSGDPSSPAL